MKLTAGVVEAGIRVAEPRLPEPLRYFSGQSQTSIHDLDVLEAKGITSNITFVGTSMVRRDIATEKIEVDLKWPRTSVHNVALPGAQTTLTKRWMLEEVVPRIHPKVVVWGVSSLDFNSGRPDHPVDRYNSARATRRGFVADLDRALETVSISKHRSTLRDPNKLKIAAQGDALHSRQAVPLARRGTWTLTYPEKTAAQLAKARMIHREYISTVQLRNFTVGDAELAAFTTTIDALRQQGIKVVILIMPVPTGYPPLHPGGKRQFVEWQQKITAAASQHGASVIDEFVQALPDEDFRDYEHLNSDPARDVFTPALVNAMRALPWWRSVFAK